MTPKKKIVRKKKAAAVKVLETRKKPSEGAVDAVAFLEGLRGGPMTLGELLREARRVDEQSLDVFAARLHISKAHLCDLEKGRRGVSIERAAKWASVLRLSEETLVERALQTMVDEAGLSLRVEVHAA